MNQGKYAVEILKRFRMLDCKEMDTPMVSNLKFVDFDLIQYFTANGFSIKEQKRKNRKYTYYTKIFPLETQTGKTNIFYIQSYHTLFTI